MNKRLQAAELAWFWKQRRTPDGYIEKLGKDGKVYERVYSPIPKQPTIKKTTQARPQPPKVRPPSQSPQTRYTPTPQDKYIEEQYLRYQQELFNRQKELGTFYGNLAKESQAASFANQRFLQKSINDTTLGVQRVRTEGDVKTAEITSQGNVKTAEITSGGNVAVAKTQADASKFSATTAADANKFGAITAAEASKFGATTAADASKYASDRDAEARNKQTDANYFVEREKNANQKEKNKQDFYLNAGLGILDSMNKQRASSSQAAAQIYSSFLSSNPYNFKYWN